MNEKQRDVAIRAVKTFWQAAIASLLVSMPQIIEGLHAEWAVLKPVLVSAFCGALAAGLSAAYNGALKPIAEKIKANKKSVE
jgi:uncharacterized membrane protein